MSLLLLDLDGPLLDVSERFYRLYASLLREQGRQPVDRAEYWDLKRSGVPERDIVSRSLSPESAECYFVRRSELIEARGFLRFDRLQPEVPEILEMLDRHRELALVTLRANCENLAWELKRFRLLEIFSSVLCAGEEGGTAQTKVDLVRAVYPRVGPNDVLVGDTEVDIQAARMLGCQACVVLSGIRRRELLIEQQPDAILDDIRQLPGWLLSHVADRGTLAGNAKNRSAT